jgi:hypothetical protein
MFSGWLSQPREILKQEGLFEKENFKAGNANAYLIAQVYVGLGDSVRRPQNSS